MSLTFPGAARRGARAASPRRLPLWPFSGSEAGAIARLAGPIVLIALVNMGMSVTDTMMVSWLFGTEALAAVAVGSDFYSIVFYLGAGVIAGLSPFFAKAVTDKSASEQEKYRKIGGFMTAATAIPLFPLVWFAPVVFCMDAGSGSRVALASGPVDLGAMAEVIRVGIPIGIATVAELGIYLGATLYAATLSAADVAAHTIALRLAGVVYAIPLALMQASTVRIARRDGSDRSGVCAAIATSQTIAVLAGIGLAALLLAIAPGIAALTFDDTQVGRAAAGLTIGLISLLAAIEFIETPGSTASGLLRGLKDTRMPMAYVLVGYWLVSAPVGVTLSKALGMGIIGVWIALLLGSLIAAGLNLLRLRRYWPAT